MIDYCRSLIRSGIELVPIYRAFKSRDIGVPDTVSAGAPGIVAVPAIETSFSETGWMNWPSMLVTWPRIHTESARVAMGTELLPTTIADCPRGICISATGDAPGVRVAPAMEIALLDSGCATKSLIVAASSGF